MRRRPALACPVPCSQRGNEVPDDGASSAAQALVSYPGAPAAPYAYAPQPSSRLDGQPQSISQIDANVVSYSLAMRVIMAEYSNESPDRGAGGSFTSRYGVPSFAPSTTTTPSPSKPFSELFDRLGISATF